MEGSETVVESLAAAIGAGLLAVQVDRAGHPNLIVDRESLLETLQLLRDGEEKFTHLSSVCGVDYSGMDLEPRFAVVYHLYSPSIQRRLTVKVPLEEGDAVVSSVTGLFPTANWHERETWDMFGIHFDGHPNLVRILTPDDFEGHPLRKEFPLGEEEIQFSHNISPSGHQPGGEASKVSRS